MSSIRISIVQTNIVWENKDANLQHITKMLEDNNVRKSIVFLPEMFNTGFSMQPTLLAETMDGETIQWMQLMARQLQLIICGSIIVHDNGKYYNRLLWVQPNGIIAHYDKRHLFAYASEDEHYAAGEKKLLVQVNNWKLQLHICYDLRFPVWSRQNADESKQYDALVYVASWPAKRIYAWQQLLIARAIENQCYVIGVNRVGKDGNAIDYNGCSVLIDPAGKVLWELKDEEGIGQFQLQLEDVAAFRTQFPFLKDADLFTIL
jgi:omega-amidase